MRDSVEWLFKMLLRYAKDAFDQARVTDGDLNVGLVAESCRWIDRIALHKHAAHEVERDRSGLFPILMKVIYDGAIEMSLQQVTAALVLGEVGIMKLRALRVGFAKAVVRGFQSAHGIVGHEIEAVSEIDDSADHERLIELLTLHRFICPLETSDRVRFPEID